MAAPTPRLHDLQWICPAANTSLAILHLSMPCSPISFAAKSSPKVAENAAIWLHTLILSSATPLTKRSTGGLDPPTTFGIQRRQNRTVLCLTRANGEAALWRPRRWLGLNVKPLLRQDFESFRVTKFSVSRCRRKRRSQNARTAHRVPPCV